MCHAIDYLSVLRGTQSGSPVADPDPNRGLLHFSQQHQYGVVTNGGSANYWTGHQGGCCMSWTWWSSTWGSLEPWPSIAPVFYCPACSLVLWPVARQSPRGECVRQHAACMNFCDLQRKLFFIIVSPHIVIDTSSYCSFKQETRGEHFRYCGHHVGMYFDQSCDKPKYLCILLGPKWRCFSYQLCVFRIIQLLTWIWNAHFLKKELKYCHVFTFLLSMSFV